MSDFETKFLPMRCAGGTACHTLFPPKLNVADKIPAALAMKPSACDKDSYVNKTDLTKSFLLAKVSATGDKLPCPTSGASDKPDQGGTRMPLKANSATMPDAPMSADELACFTWWVKGLAAK